MSQRRIFKTREQLIEEDTESILNASREYTEDYDVQLLYLLARLVATIGHFNSGGQYRAE